MGSVKSLVAVESVHPGPHVKAIPDVILPSQFFELVGARTFSSEQRLMLAVLADAINVMREYRASPNRDKRNSFNEASSWVFANGIAGQFKEMGIKLPQKDEAYFDPSTYSWVPLTICQIKDAANRLVAGLSDSLTGHVNTRAASEDVGKVSDSTSVQVDKAKKPDEK